MIMGIRVTLQKTCFWDIQVRNAPAHRSRREALALMYYPTWTTYKRASERGKTKSLHAYFLYSPKEYVYFLPCDHL